jgi:mono/diheme cytochrome c family protein
LLLVAGLSAGVAWQKFRRGEAQVFASEAARFKYGSLGAELAGIPYPIFMILPRVFPDLVEKYARQGYGPARAGWGGYAAFGLAWEPGERLPVGFSVKTQGYERVTVNCALCHTATYRVAPDAPRVVVAGGAGHTVDLQALLRFLFACANDARFTPARLMPEIALHVKLDWLDWQIYSFVLIPAMRTALRLVEHELAWMDARTPWGPGRDDAFNLPKFVLLQQPWDDTDSTADFPALFRMAERDGRLVHAAGEAKTLYAVSATSALGVGALPGHGFRAVNEWLVSYIRKLQPPSYPLPVDTARAARGKALFDARCAECHAPDGARTGTAIPLAEIGTDPERVLEWSARDAAHMNRLVSTLGIDGAELQGAQGYVAKPLAGVWLQAPYLHNGAVPTIADLLRTAAERPRVFFRGYDVLDPTRLGYVAIGPAATAEGFRYDTSLRGNGNGGHTWGTDLGEGDRAALIEYLKTL